MATTKENNGIWLNAALSSKLIGSEFTDDYNQAIEELRKVASKMAPGGRLVTFVSTEGDKFRPIEKLAANLAMSKTIYNERSITTNPEFSIELAEILKLVNELNKIIDKRKTKLSGNRDNRAPKNKN